jgi:nitrogen fixation protein
MAIIYTYPLNSIIRSEDILIGTSTRVVDGQKKNITKNFSIGDLTDFVRVNVSLDDVLAVNNVSTQDAKIGSLYLYDTPLLDYGNITLSQNAYAFYSVAYGEVFRMRKGLFRALSTDGYKGNFILTGLTQDRSWEMPNKDGIVAMISDIPSPSGYVPATRTLTINGVTYDLSANRSWTISTSGGEWGDITGNILNQGDLITYLEENYYPLNTNPAGYLTSASLTGYATEAWTTNNFYPLNSNPAGYLTQSEVEEYPNLASFPPTGTAGVIYIALDTGLFYSWNGSAYVSSAPPDTGITGGGIVNRLPKFTPNGVTIGNSNFSDDGLGGRYTISSNSYLAFYAGGNTWLRLQRASSNRMEFILGNPGASQPNEITSSNSYGLEFSATAATAYLALKAGGTNEGLRVLPTGKITLAQTPDTGTTSDFLLMRDTSGNVKQIAYPTIPSVSGYVPYTGATQNVDLGEFELKAGQLTLDVSPTGTAAVGTTRWNNTIGSSETTLKGGNVILKNGVDLVARVVNKVTPNATLLRSNYQAVRVSGAQGQRLAVAYAQANNDNNSADTIGLVCENISTNQEGFIMTVGQLENINTTGSLQGETWNDGDVLYLSPTIAGRITNVKPSAPGHIVIMGYVEYAHINHGKIYVKIMNGWELDELHNVSISSPTNGQGLVYNSVNSLWENKNVQLKSIKLSAQTLAVGSWTLVGSYYQYTFTNANIVSTGYVDFTPNNTSVLEVTTCKMLPEITANNGNCVFYSQFPPQNDITGEIIIHVL